MSEFIGFIPFLTEPTNWARRLRDRWKIDRGVVDAVADVREDGHGVRQADLHQLLVGMPAALMPSSSSLIVPLVSARFLHETHQGIPRGVARGLAGADLLQDLRRKACHLAEQAVRGHAVIATRDFADDAA